MDPYRIQVFHIAYGDGGVVFVPHHLVFDLFIAFYALFDEHLADRGKGKGVFHHGNELGLIVNEASAGSSQCKSGAKHHRITDLRGHLDSLFHSGGDVRRQGGFSQTFAQLFKQLPVFCPLNA